jgi:hypothetical protein
MGCRSGIVDDGVGFGVRYDDDAQRWLAYIVPESPLTDVPHAIPGL